MRRLYWILGGVIALTCLIGGLAYVALSIQTRAYTSGNARGPDTGSIALRFDRLLELQHVAQPTMILYEFHRGIHLAQLAAQPVDRLVESGELTGVVLWAPDSGCTALVGADLTGVLIEQ